MTTPPAAAATGVDPRGDRPARALVRRREQRQVAPIERRVRVGEQEPRAVADLGRPGNIIYNAYHS